MKKYHVEISGSPVVTEEVDTLEQLIEIARVALGQVSVVTEHEAFPAGVEVFFGSGQELEREILFAQEEGYELGEPWLELADEYRGGK